MYLQVSGQDISITFSVSGNAAPFDYVISADDNVVAGGNMISGTLTLFVSEVVANQAGGLLPTVCDAVLARAARLSPSARAVLEAAAVIGPRVEPWTLAEVTGAEAQFADECLHTGMLVAAGEALAFRHELARQTILDSISPTHRLALHRMTLAALRANPSTRGDLTRLAHHAEGASDREAILALAPAAARQAVSARAHRAAAELFRVALQFGDEPPVAVFAHWREAAPACAFSNRFACSSWRPPSFECRQGV